MFGLEEEEEKEMSLNILFFIKIICKGFTWPHDCGNRRCRNCLQNIDDISFQSFSSYCAAMMLIGVLSFFIVAVFGELLIGGNVSPAERGPTV